MQLGLLKVKEDFELCIALLLLISLLLLSLEMDRGNLQCTEQELVLTLTPNKGQSSDVQTGADEGLCSCNQVLYMYR